MKSFFRMILPPMILSACAPVCRADAAGRPEDWSIHFQATTVTQGHPGFHAPYSGPLSLGSRKESETSLTSTLFIGRRLWNGGELFVDPELSGGSGISGSHGVAGFPNGEIYRVSSSHPKMSLARAFVRQTWALSGDMEPVGSDENQLGGTQPADRFSVIVGKFSLIDFFDDNTYSHDPRTQFLNWALMANGAWDYAADTRGYTWGIVTEYARRFWTLRLGSVLVPKEANMLQFDQRPLTSRGDNAELEHRYMIRERPGAFRLLAYVNHARMGSYRKALDDQPQAPDITQTRRNRIKYGFGANMEQKLTGSLGVFARAGWNDGRTETWTFTEIDRTVSAGLRLKGNAWRRSEDEIGLAGIANGLSKDHRDYLKAGGLGFIVGDGRLDYAPEQIVEAYYRYKAAPFLDISPDAQFIRHPAYNADRGPVIVWGLRVHLAL